MVKEKEIPIGYKQTEIGVIPEDWEVLKLGSIADILVGGDLKEQHFSSYQDDKFKYPVFSNTVSQFGLYGFYDFAEYKGESLTIVGRGVGLGTAFTRSNGYGAIGRLLVLFPDKNVHANFLTEYINHKVKIFSESGGIPQLTGISISKYLIPLPPSKIEQTAISAILLDTEILINQLEKFIVKKKNIKLGAIQELLTGKKRLQGFTGKWEEVKVGDIAKIGRGRVISQKEMDPLIQGSYPVYSSQTSNNGIMGYINTFDFDGEYVTWTTDGEKAGKVFYRNGKFNCTNVCGTIKLKKDNAQFFAMLLDTITPQYVSKNLANPKLMNDPVKKIIVSMPKIEEQTAIAKILSDMDTEIDTLEQKRNKYIMLKQGMMEQLLTGKIRIV